MRARIETLTRAIPRRPDRATKRPNLHITLVFLGAVDEATHQCLEREATRVAGAAFTLVLDRLGYFPRPQILWLGPSVCPNALTDLVAELGVGLKQCGLRPETRPYKPHMTLARRVRSVDTGVEIAPIEWRINSYHLVESITEHGGVRYQSLRQFSLGRI